MMAASADGIRLEGGDGEAVLSISASRIALAASCRKLVFVFSQKPSRSSSYGVSNTILKAQTASYVCHCFAQGTQGGDHQRLKELVQFIKAVCIDFSHQKLDSGDAAEAHTNGEYGPSLNARGAKGFVSVKRSNPVFGTSLAVDEEATGFGKLGPDDFEDDDKAAADSDDFGSLKANLRGSNQSFDSGPAWASFEGATESSSPNPAAKLLTSKATIARHAEFVAKEGALQRADTLAGIDEDMFGGSNLKMDPLDELMKSVDEHLVDDDDDDDDNEENNPPTFYDMC